MGKGKSMAGREVDDQVGSPWPGGKSMAGREVDGGEVDGQREGEGGKGR